MRRIVTYIASCALLAGVLFACKEAPKVASFHEWKGQTMGTFAEWKADVDPLRVQTGVDSLLTLINDVASTYIPSSSIMQFNGADKTHCIQEPSHVEHFIKLLELSKQVHAASEGFFDPSLMPLVNYWGFGYKKRAADFAYEKAEVDSLLTYVGFDKIAWSEDKGQLCISKSDPMAQLDFSAVAKGYGVDLIANYLRDRGAANYYVNIGGEVVVSGNNKKGNPWTLGVNYPDTAAALQDIVGTIKLTQGGMASSGNYRMFYSDKNGYTAHTINPRTGMAAPSDLLSATVVAGDCATADAFATAAMAMGYDAAKRMVEAEEAIDALLIFKAEGGEKLEYFISPSLQEKISMTQ